MLMRAHLGDYERIEERLRTISSTDFSDLVDNTFNGGSK